MPVVARVTSATPGTAGIVTVFGAFLSAEEHPPLSLVSQAVRAEQAGFEALWISDHYHPWTGAQGHAPFVWSVLGAIAAQTSAVRCTTAVTAPTVGWPPASATATSTSTPRPSWSGSTASGAAPARRRAA